MFVQNLPVIVRVVRNLADRGHRVHIRHAVGQPGEQRHQEHRHRTGGDQRGRGHLLHRTRFNRDCRHRNNQRQRSRTIHSDGHTVMRRHRVRLAVQGHGDIHRHRTNQHQHDDEHNQQSRIAADGLQINRRARNDEENRDEEAVRNPVKPRFQGLRAFRNHVSQNESRGKRAQHHVKVENRGHRHQRDEQQHSQAHEYLLGNVRMLGHEPVEPVARLACLRWHKRRDRANHGEYGEGEESLPLRARGQQHRHHQHRAQLTPRAVGDHRVADRRAFESAFLENRH